MASPFSLGDFTYAHRGLWQPSGPAENTMAACRAAAEAGCGIEFDVRLTADGVPICFHDTTLDRMTDGTGAVAEHTAEALAALDVGGSGEPIPLLSTLLGEWSHHLPLLVEMKSQAGNHEALAGQVTAQLEAYEGRAAAMSFDPRAVAALPRDMPRGLLIKPMSDIGEAAFEEALQAGIEDLHVDYFGVRHEDAPIAGPRAHARGLGCVVWTVTSPAESASVAPYCDAQIFEGFSPDLVARGNRP